MLLAAILLGCSSEVKLQLEFNKNCFNKYFNNEAHVTVQKIGGGYESGEIIEVLDSEAGVYFYQIKSHGEIWKAKSTTSYRQGDKVKVKEIL